jgi:hypothetical protein
MASYTIVTAIAANVAGNTNTINSTKVKVVANAACVYAINAPATLTSNVGAMIPANFPTYINMTGIGNRISVLPVAGGSTAITLTECGTVYQSAMNQNVLNGVFTMTTSNATIVGSTAGLGIISGMYVTGGNIRGNPTVTTVNSGNIVLSTASGIGSNITATLTFSVTAIQTA